LTAQQIEGRRPVLEALHGGRDITEILIASGARMSGAIAEIVRFAQRRSIPVRHVSRQEIATQARTRNPQGVIAVASAFPYAEIDDVVQRSTTEPLLLVAVDGMTDPQNLGAVARAAEAAGAHGLIVPRRRSAGVTEAAERASAGALEHLPVAIVANLARTLAALSERGVWIVALDPGAEAEIYDLPVATEALCLVVGGEGKGVSRLVRDRADHRVAIPMSGRIASLNAAAAAAVALFEIRRQRRP
jgi:23S rRNA (guanosine2251-2'-O)-methyltransferase